MRSRKPQNPKPKTPQTRARGRNRAGVCPYRRLLFVDKMRQTVQRGRARLSFSEHWPKRVVAAATEPPRGLEWERGWHTSCYTRHWLHSGEVRMLIRAARSRRGLTSTGQSGYRRLKAERMREYLARKSTWRK